MTVPVDVRHGATAERATERPGCVRVVVAGEPATVMGIVRRVAGDGLAVVAVAGDGEQLVESFCRHRPDVVVSEWRLSRVSGREALDRMLAVDPAARVVFLASRADPWSVRQGLNAGASGYLLSTVGAPGLSEGVRAAARGLVVLDASATRSLAGRPDVDGDEEPTACDGRLSTRERAVLLLVAEGCTNPQIAEQLGIRLATVKTHLGRISMKLGVHGRLAAAREAGALGML